MLLSHTLTRRKIAVTIAVVALATAVTFGLSMRPSNQQVEAHAQPINGNTQADGSIDQMLRVEENDDSPLRVSEARVKEVSGFQFTQLTGKTTDLPVVSSVPEVKLLNSSTKTITGFVFVIRDPESKVSRGVIQNNVLIAPGETFALARQSFLKSDSVTVADTNGQIREKLIQPDMRSEKYWMPFAGRSRLFVTVAKVSFHDGTSWKVREGAKIK